MKNLTFEFSNYDKVFNLECNKILLIKLNQTNIEAKLNIFDKTEISYDFIIDNGCILSSLQVIFSDNKLFMTWVNNESNVILGIYRIENTNILSKNQLVVSYNFNKTCNNPILSYNNNKLSIFWLESDYYDSDYSKFDLKHNIYDIDETSDEIYVNLIDTNFIVENLDINVKSNIYCSYLNEKINNFYYIYGYKNKLDKYKILFVETNKLNSFYINTDENNILSISTFVLGNNIYIMWINDKNQILGRIIREENNKYMLDKNIVDSLTNSFNLFYQKDLYQELEADKLIKLPFKLYDNEMVNTIMYTSGKSSFIIILDTNNNCKMIIKFELNKLNYLNNLICKNNNDTTTVLCETNNNLNFIVFFKYTILNEYLLCYQERDKKGIIKTNYNINKIEEIMIEIEKGVDQINENLINFNEKNLSIYKLFNQN